MDAELLARLGRGDPSPLKPIVHRGAQAQRDRILIQARAGFVRVRTRYPETELLRRVPGVGAITALYYVLTIEDPSRFAKSRSVGAYVPNRAHTK